MQYFKLGRLKTKRTKALQVNWRHAMLFCYVMLLSFWGFLSQAALSVSLNLDVLLFASVETLEKNLPFVPARVLEGYRIGFFKNPISFMVSWLSTNGNDWPIQICDILTFPSYLYLGEISHYVVTRKYNNIMIFFYV